jgi:hypothetical protein
MENSLVYLWKRNNALPALLTGIILLQVSSFLPGAVGWSTYATIANLVDVVSAVVGCTLVFTGIDLLGYAYLVNNEDTDGSRASQVQEMAYRLIQLTVQIKLINLSMTSAGIFAAVSWTALWWFGVCDLLYYVLGKYPLHSGEWNWLWWTAFRLFGHVKKLLDGVPHTTARENTKFKTNEVMLQSAVGIIVSSVLIILQVLIRGNAV